jgi:membrane protease YdiL (CAAX protease family)
LNEFGEVIVEVNNDEELKLKQSEITDFKRTLRLLALTVLLAVAAKWLMFFLVSVGIQLYIDSLPTVPIEEIIEAELPEPAELSEAAWNFIYFLDLFLSHLIMLMPPLVIFGLAFRRKLGFEKPGEPYEFNAAWVIPVFIASYAVSFAANYLSHLLAWVMRPVFGTGELRNPVEDIMPQTDGTFVIALIMIGFIGPVLEELIYRHLLLRPLRRFGDFQAVIITALLFGFFHGNLAQFLYTFTGGVIYGIVAVKMNSVKPAIVLHIINNVFVLVLARVSAHPEVDEDFLGLTLLAFIAVGVGILIYFLVKKLFKTENYNPYISTGERARIIAENPLILIMFLVLIAETVIGTS